MSKRHIRTVFGLAMKSMKGEDVKVVVVGCGAVSQIMYVPALKVLEKRGLATVAALIDPAEKERAKVQKEFPKALAFTDIASCPLSPRHLVIVASPPNLHAEHSIQALQKGAAVLCEKPMATSSHDAEAMIRAKGPESILSIGHFRRFYPASDGLMGIFKTKPFGNLRSFNIQEGGKFGWGAVSDSVFRSDLMPGGVLFDMGIHVINLLLAWFGEPLEFSYEDDAMGGLEANCRLQMTYPGGVRGVLRLSWDWETANRHVYEFEKATVVFNSGAANHLSFFVDDTPFVFDAELKNRPKSDRNFASGPATSSILQSFTDQLINVVAAMNGQERLRVSGEDGARSLRFVESCYKRRRPMEMNWMSEGEKETIKQLIDAV